MKPRLNAIKYIHRPALWLSLWLLWMLALFGVYYQKIWAVFSLGPDGWMRQNYSLPLVDQLQAQFLDAEMRWLFPAWQESAQRAAGAFLGAGLILLAAQLPGAVILRLASWQAEERAEALLYRTATGLGGLSYLLLALALGGQYRPASVQVLSGVLSLAGVLAWGFTRPGRRKRLLRDVSAPAPAPAGLGASGRRLNLWALVALPALLVGLVGALAPEHEADAMWYHLWLPRLWLENGAPVDVIQEYVSLYPLTWELIYGAAMSLGGATAAKLVNYAVFLLLALLVYRSARRYLPGVEAWLAVAFFVTIPTVLWESTTAYADLGLALFVALSFYAWLRYLDTRRRPWLVLSGIQLGLALASKHLALIVLVILVVGLALALWWEARSLRKALLPALLLGGLALLIPLPWYLRSWLASGNPVFPELYRVFGAFPPGRWDARSEAGLAAFKDHFGFGRSLLRLALLPWDMTVHSARFGGSLGPLFLALLPGALAGPGRSRTAVLAGGFLAGYIVFWASPISSFQMRFLVSITPVLALLAAAGYRRLAALLRPFRHARVGLPAAAVALLLLNLPPFTSLHEADRVGNDGWLTHVTYRLPLGVVVGKESEAEYLRRAVPSYPAWEYVNANCRAGTRVLTFSGEDHLYSHCPRLSDEATLARAVTWGAPPGKEEQALAELRRLKITHILFDLRKLGNQQQFPLAIAAPEFAARNLALEYRDPRYRLYRVLSDNEVAR